MAPEMRMRQSLADLEQAFHEQQREEQERAEALRRQALQRTRQREVQRVQKRSTFRFVLLVLAMIATAAGVTVAMFETLYIVLG